MNTAIKQHKILNNTDTMSVEYIKHNKDYYNLEEFSKYSKYFKSLPISKNNQVLHNHDKKEIIDVSYKGKEMHSILELLSSNLTLNINIRDKDKSINLMYLIEEMQLFDEMFIRQIHFETPMVAYDTLQYIENNESKTNSIPNILSIMKRQIKKIFSTHYENVKRLHNMINESNLKTRSLVYKIKDDLNKKFGV